MKPESLRNATEKYFHTVYRLALSRTKNVSDAEDVTQEVFLKLIKNNKPFESDEHLKAWLIRVTINCSISILKSSFRKKTLPLTEEIPFKTKEESDVYYAVAELPLKYRTVIHLFYYEDLPIAKIAEILKTKEPTIKTRLLRARKMLSEKLSIFGKEEYFV